MSHISLTVLVSEPWRDRFGQVVANCRLAGMTIERELVAIGVIAGSIDETRVSALSAIAGVDAVEPERTTHAMPDHPGPDSPSEV